MPSPRDPLDPDNPDDSDSPPGPGTRSANPVAAVLHHGGGVGTMNVALLAVNAAQLKFLVDQHEKEDFSAKDYTLMKASMALIGVSVVLQVILKIAIIYNKRFKPGRFQPFQKLLVYVIMVVNIFIMALDVGTTYNTLPKSYNNSVMVGK